MELAVLRRQGARVGRLRLLECVLQFCSLSVEVHVILCIMPA